LVRWALFCAGLSFAYSAMAQQSPKPADAIPLPPVTVETTKAPPPAKKKKTASAKSKAPQAAAVSPAPVPPHRAATGAQGESGIGPVDGYVATQTTSGSKTDTPIVEIPRTVNVSTQDQIEAQQPKTIREAIGYVPAVQTQSGAGSVLENIVVRGFSAP